MIKSHRMNDKKSIHAHEQINKDNCDETCGYSRSTAVN